jgi:hypothetical protein
MDKLAIPDGALDGVDFLVLPQNADTDPIDKLRETSDGVDFAKHLRSQGKSLRTAYDFNSEMKVFDRRAADVWLGALWILNEVAAPVLVGTLLLWLNSKFQGSKRGDVHLELLVKSGSKFGKMKFDGPMNCLEKLLAGFDKSKVSRGLQRGSSDNATESNQ